MIEDRGLRIEDSICVPVRDPQSSILDPRSSTTHPPISLAHQDVESKKKATTDEHLVMTHIFCFFSPGGTP